MDTNIDYFEKVFRLTTTKSTTNMYLFNNEQKLKKYDDIYKIIEEYYPVRYEAYIRRKAHIVDTLEKYLITINNKARFIKENCDEIIDLRRKKKDVIIALLKSRGYDIINDDEEYMYLRKMPMDSVCEENFAKLLQEKGEKEAELNCIKKTKIEDMWTKELEELYKAYSKYKNNRKVRSLGVSIKSKKKKKNKK